MKENKERKRRFNKAYQSKEEKLQGGQRREKKSNQESSEQAIKQTIFQRANTSARKEEITRATKLVKESGEVSINTL